MKKLIPVLAALAFAVPGLSFAATRTALTGEYVEARTAEVFAGGCIMASEAETMGRQAILAWHIGSGAFDGVALDGLTVVAAVAGDRNLGIQDVGGLAPSVVRAVLVVDQRATARQRRALVALARQQAPRLIRDIVAIKAAPIRFDDTEHAIRVSAGPTEVTVAKHVEHDPSCGAMQWFRPFVALKDSTMGLTEQQVFSGDALGVKWSDPGKRSAFWGRFSD